MFQFQNNSGPVSVSPGWSAAGWPLKFVVFHARSGTERMLSAAPPSRAGAGGPAASAFPLRPSRFHSAMPVGPSKLLSLLAFQLPIR